MDRIILHSDLNNYYASVECLQHPELRDRFVAVCGKKEERHGIVLAKNQKAKRCGVRTGETIWQARQKCPQLVVVPPHFDLYIAYSQRVRQIYHRYTNKVEPYGLDECWLDVSANSAKGQAIAEHIRRTVKKELGITVSVGVSFNKIFAKLGSDLKKPDAVTCIERENFRERIWPLPMGAMLGVGRATERKLRLRGLRTIGDIAACERRLLAAWLGANGEKLWQYANGLDLSRVRAFDDSPTPKSVSHGITCTEDLYTGEQVGRVLLELAQSVAHRLREAGLAATGVELGIRDNKLHRRQWQGPAGHATQSWRALTERGMALFSKNYTWQAPVRALTIGAIGLVPAGLPVQLNFLDDGERMRKIEDMECAVERVRNKYGRDAVKLACAMADLKMPTHNPRQALVLPPAMYV